jgi:hypothetical protein
VYTAPTLVRYDLRFAVALRHFQVVEFPNVHLYDAQSPAIPDQDGYATLRSVVNLRLQYLNLEPEQVIDAEALNILISGTGGLLRDLIRLIQDAAARAELQQRDRIDAATVHNVIATLRRLYASHLTDKHYQELQRVHTAHALAGTDAESELLRANFIISHINDDVWFDAHPILWPHLDRQV